MINGANHLDLTAMVQHTCPQHPKVLGNPVSGEGGI